VSHRHVALQLASPRAELAGRHTTLALGPDSPPPTPVVVWPETLPPAIIGVPYAQTLSATGGTGPYTYALTGGALPGGLALSGADITGTPTVATASAFDVEAADSLDSVGARSYTILVTDPVWRGLSASFGLPWRRRETRARAVASGWDKSRALDHVAWLNWSAAQPRGRDIDVPWSPTTALTAMARVAWSTRARLSTEIKSGWGDLRALTTDVVLSWSLPAAINRELAIPWRSPPPAQRECSLDWRTRPPLARVVSASWRAPPHVHREYVLPWRRGQMPPWVILPSVTTGPPPPPPSRSGRHIELRLSCPRRPGPSSHLTLPLGPWQCYIGRRQPKVYIVKNIISIVRVPDNAPIAAHDVSIRGDLESAVWDCSVSISSAASLALLQPGPSGAPRRFRVTINGWAWEFLAESDQAVATFGGTARTVTGRSPTAVLSSEYASHRTVTQASARDASQLAAEVLSGTGITLDWQATDWLVPGGIWSYSDLSPLDALREIASASGAVVQSHRTADTVHVIPTYATRPWQWGITPPDVEIVDDYLKARGGSSARGIRHNTVEVRGDVAGGIRGICTILGTAGDKALPQVTHRLITAAAAAEARGIHELSRVGPIGEVSVDLPLFAAPAAPGLVTPGTLVRVSGSYRALATAVQIRASWPAQGGCTVNQTISMERHFDA